MNLFGLKQNKNMNNFSSVYSVFPIQFVRFIDLQVAFAVNI